MLVLTRQHGESIRIGDDITITVVETRAGGVRIGIDAPRHVRISRAETFEKIERANREAITGVGGEQMILDAIRRRDTVADTAI